MADEAGATSIEYSIIAVLVSIGAVAALTLIGPQILAMFQQANAPL